MTSRPHDGGMQASGSLEDGTLVVRLAGELDVATAPTVAEFVQLEVAAVQPERLVVDVSEVGFVDSSGLAALLAIRRGVPAGTLVLHGAGPQLLRLLTITGVDQLLTVEADGPWTEADGPPPDTGGDRPVAQRS